MFLIFLLKFQGFQPKMSLKFRIKYRKQFAWLLLAAAVLFRNLAEQPTKVIKEKHKKFYSLLAMRILTGFLLKVDLSINVHTISLAHTTVKIIIYSFIYSYNSNPLRCNLGKWVNGITKCVS